MAANPSRLSQRSRIGPVRVKADENAYARHTRQPSGIPVVGANRLAQKEVNGSKVAHIRAALTEVTRTTVNRSDNITSVVTGKTKDENNIKRIPTVTQSYRATSIGKLPVKASGPVRIPLSRVPSNKSQAPVHRIPRIPPPPVVVEEDLDDYVTDAMEVVQEEAVQVPVDVPLQPEEVEELDPPTEPPQSDLIDLNDDSDMEMDDDKVVGPSMCMWPDVSPRREAMYEKQVNHVRRTFVDEPEESDPTMVAEYAEEIFQYMAELEEEILPDPDYIAIQNEVNWDMRQILVDWLASIHLVHHMLPETLWIGINIMDRFLSKRSVSKVKLQLVGLTSMFIACKYEEILAPALEEFVNMAGGAFTREDITKGERIILQVLGFHVSHYCSPYSWMRKISKADDYDLQTRTLSKFLTEVTLLDHRFLRVKPRTVAAVGMYSARKMLGGDWNDAFVYHSGYTEEQLVTGHKYIVETLQEEKFRDTFLFKKYSHRKFLKASWFAVQFAEGLMQGEAS